MSAMHQPNLLLYGPMTVGRLKLLELAVVLTVTVAVEDVPLTIIEAGEMEQVDKAGAPLQTNVTFWLKPPAEDTVSL